MLLTEAEAKQRWCPFGVQPIAGQAGAATLGASHTYVVAGNRCQGDVPACLASSCMAWRWHDRKMLREIDPTTGDVEDEQPRRGFCGAFGRPTEE